MRRIFVPQLDHKEVAPILRANGFKWPPNVRRPVARWHHGNYYGYGNKDSWFPLNSMGGIATKAFHDMTVEFPASIEEPLLAMLEALRHPRLAKRNALPTDNASKEYRKGVE